MIIVAIIALSGVVLAAIMVALGNGLPALPASVVSLINQLLDILNNAAGLFWSFVLPEPVKVMFGLTLLAVGIYEGYKIVMWIAKKIPMFGVSD